MGGMDLPRMPLTTASAVTLLYAIGYPIGTLAVTAMTPMAVLVLRFGLAAIILASWTMLARAAWPRGAQLGHVAVAGLLIQAVQFCALYEAVRLGAPAVLCAVVIAMNPATTAILASAFLREPLGVRRAIALVLGVVECSQYEFPHRLLPFGWMTWDPRSASAANAADGITAVSYCREMRECASGDRQSSTTLCAFRAQRGGAWPISHPTRAALGRS